MSGQDHQSLPKIGIITPNYNQGPFLAQAIESVLGQRYPHLEYIVMDGASTDTSLEVLRSYGHRVKWISRRDSGQTNAINQGIKKLEGVDIVGFLNADDVLAPNALWEVAAEWNKQPFGWIVGDYSVIDSDGQSVDGVTVRFKQLCRRIMAQMPQVFPTMMAITNPIPQPSTFWNAAIHDSGEFLDESEHLIMDYEWWWRLWQHFGPPEMVPYVWSAFRVHADSKGGQFFAQRLNEHTRVAHRYGQRGWPLFLGKAHNWLATKLYALHIR